MQCDFVQVEPGSTFAGAHVYLDKAKIEPVYRLVLAANGMGKRSCILWPQVCFSVNNFLLMALF
jgi:hypothetical protein